MKKCCFVTGDYFLSKDDWKRKAPTEASLRGMQALCKALCRSNLLMAIQAS